MRGAQSQGSKEATAKSEAALTGRTAGIQYRGMKQDAHEHNQSESSRREQANSRHLVDDVLEAQHREQPNTKRYKRGQSHV